MPDTSTNYVEICRTRFVEALEALDGADLCLTYELKEFLKRLLRDRTNSEAEKIVRDVKMTEMFRSKAMLGPVLLFWRFLPETRGIVKKMELDIEQSTQAVVFKAEKLRQTCQIREGQLESQSGKSAYRLLRLLHAYEPIEQILGSNWPN